MKAFCTSIWLCLSAYFLSFVGAQAQHVGIGVADPQRRLHVAQEIDLGHIQPEASLFRLQNTQATTCPGTVNIWDVRVGNCGQMGVTTYETNSTPFFNVLKASANPTLASAGPILSVNTTAPINTLMINNLGNVGVGEVAPATKLHIQQNTALRLGEGFLSSGGPFLHLSNNNWYNGAVWSANLVDREGALVQLFNGDINFYHSSAGVGVPTLTPNFRFTSTGRAGIGNVIPTTRLTVNGSYRGGYRLVTAATTLNCIDDYYVHIAGAGDYIVTLPDPATCGAGTILSLRTQFNAGTKTIASASGSQIRLAGSPALLASFGVTGGQSSHRGMTFLSDGSAWNQVGEAGASFTESTYHNYNTPTFHNGGGNRYSWFPTSGGDGSDDLSSAGPIADDRRALWLAPYNGRLVRVIVRVSNFNSNPGIDLRAPIALAVNGIATTYTAGILNLDNGQQGTVEIPIGTAGFSFNAGDRISLGFDSNDLPGCSGGDCMVEDNNYFITAVWEFQR